MTEDSILYCLIAFILGWLVSRHVVNEIVGNDFSIGGQSNNDTCCQNFVKNWPDSKSGKNPTWNASSGFCDCDAVGREKKRICFSREAQTNSRPGKLLNACINNIPLASCVGDKPDAPLGDYCEEMSGICTGLDHKQVSGVFWYDKKMKQPECEEKCSGSGLIHDRQLRQDCLGYTYDPKYGCMIHIPKEIIKKINCGSTSSPPCFADNLNIISSSNNLLNKNAICVAVAGKNVNPKNDIAYTNLLDRRKTQQCYDWMSNLCSQEDIGMDQCDFCKNYDTDTDTAAAAANASCVGEDVAEYCMSGLPYKTHKKILQINKCNNQMNYLCTQDKVKKDICDFCTTYRTDLTFNNKIMSSCKDGQVAAYCRLVCESGNCVRI